MECEITVEIQLGGAKIRSYFLASTPDAPRTHPGVARATPGCVRGASGVLRGCAPLSEL